MSSIINKNYEKFGKMVSVRLANLSDSKEIFNWRNDNTTRKMSHTNEIIDWQEHNHWFDSNLESKSQYLLICYIEETHEKVAAVRFNLQNNIAIISINLSPSMRGKGFAVPCLNEAIDYFISKFSSLSIIEAEIKPVNLASIKAFEAVGFVLNRQDKEIQYYKLIL
jgi:RimJ/RimL family protein N-acetyltransferase